MNKPTAWHGFDHTVWGKTCVRSPAPTPIQQPPLRKHPSKPSTPRNPAGVQAPEAPAQDMFVLPRFNPKRSWRCEKQRRSKAPGPLRIRYLNSFTIIYPKIDKHWRQKNCIPWVTRRSNVQKKNIYYIYLLMFDSLREGLGAHSAGILDPFRPYWKRDSVRRCESLGHRDALNYSITLATRVQ